MKKRRDYSTRIDWDTHDRFSAELRALGISERAHNCLMNTSYESVEEVSRTTDKELLRWVQLGKVALADIRSKIPFKQGPRMRFEIYRDAKDEWRWRLLTANNRIIANSAGDGYHNEADCRDAITLVQSSFGAVVGEGKR